MRTVVAVVAITFTFCGVATAQGQRQQGAPATPPALAPEAAAALEELEPRYATEIGLTQGWFRDRNVLYYDFGSVPIGASAGRTASGRDELRSAESALSNELLALRGLGDRERRMGEAVPLPAVCVKLLTNTG